MNGKQTDPAISADNNGNFIITWTYIAQDNSYFGGIYGRQFNNEAQPTSGDITFASTQVSSHYFGPSYVAMSEAGFAVVTWNYGLYFYQSVLEPYSDVFIIDGQRVGTGVTYGSSVSFDYNNRYALAYTQEQADGVGGTPMLPVTDSYVTVYEITELDTQDDDDDLFAEGPDEPADDAANDNADDVDEADGLVNLSVGQRLRSTKYA